MTRFIQQSACEGRRPHGVVPDRLRSRPRLLSRLLEDRGALRLVVAPPGFGKATLAFEYASVMFQFEHVFWLRGSSPCFLRDLDAGVLAEAVLEADEHAALMVVADLPVLTDDRAEAFAEVVERLADASCEVIATTTRADAPMELFGRRVVIEAAEMLVAREDLEEEPEGVTDRRPLGLAERIAALRWGSATPIQLVLGASRAGCTPEEELALWAMTVLGRGTIDDVRALLGARRAEKAWDALAARCPLVGISAGEESFAALSVSLGEVRDHGRARLQALAETCGFAGREEAIEVLAERLMERGECGRAVSAMTLLARRRAHGRWLAANGWAALWGGAAVEVCELYESATRTQMAARADINAMIAWAWAQRGDRARAVQFAQRSLVSERSTPRTVLSAALAAWEVGNAATRRAMEETVASCLAELDGAGGVEREDGLAELVVVAHGVLALLALHRGRELGRDQIVSMLWPAADKRTGAKSFYRVWGDLRSLLSQQGSCPYLIRSRYGCRLDPDLFESDLDEFEELIRCLLFGPADDMAWERAIATIQGSFGSVLLPTERKCEAIVVFRDRLDAEFVDGLVAASRRLLVRGELQGALWLAREAFQRDAGREDAAAALMRAQMATDQRSAAVQTFFACRDRLSRTLGLDPSPALAALYRQLLEGELSFA